MINKFNINQSFEYENGFILTSEPYRLGNFIAHYELYKKIIGLPGNVLELGVFKGNSLIQFATYRELLENEKSRKIVGFDAFGEFPTATKYEGDKVFVEKWNSVFKTEFLSKEDIEKSFQLKNIDNIQLVQGNILETLPKFLEENPHERIALLHIDVDVYEPTKLALELLYDRVVPGGIIIFDDYGTVEGETEAVDEFLLKHQHKLCKLSLSHNKPTYIIKE